MVKSSDKQALAKWEAFKAAISNSTPIDTSESEADKKKRIKKLEADPEAWFKYYFPKYCFAPPAAFQMASTRRIMRAEKHFYQRRAWARGLAKSTRRMMEVMYIMFAKSFRVNALLISKSSENATRLLDTYQVNLEANNRIINDYGIQEKPGKWTQGEFTTRKGCTFRAVGADQNPRGAKNEELRINVIIFDDVDDDEVCRNPDRLNQRWLWIEQAVIPTVDIAAMYYIFFDNNIIAEDSLAVRAAKYATDVETINIRNDQNQSSWPEKNSEEQIDAIISSMSWESAQKEYFNNPMSEGKTFKNILWGKCPSLKSLPFVIAYADPSYSNKDKPSSRSGLQNSCKAVVLIGYRNNQFFLYKCFVDHATNSTFIHWLYQIRVFVANQCPLYVFVENNSLQDPFYQQVLLPLIYQHGKEYGSVLPITPDESRKGEKWFRIEATLEPLFRLGNFVFNQDQEKDPHTLRMIAQFLSASVSSKNLDGPDAVQGAVAQTQIRTSVIASEGIQLTKRTRPPSKAY